MAGSGANPQAAMSPCANVPEQRASSFGMPGVAKTGAANECSPSLDSTGPASPREPSKSAKSLSRVPVERLLPAKLIGKLADLARAAPEVTSELCAEADRRWSITERYGLSRRRLLNYLRRMHGKRGEDGKDTSAAGQKPPEDGQSEKSQDFRIRQVSVGAILDKMFGPLAKCKPELWDRRAYLMLVGLVYERLAVSEKGIPTDELVAFAKVLAENRRIEARLQQADQSNEPPNGATSGDGKLPPRFGDIIRQLYGTNFQQSAADGQEGPSGQAKPVDH